MRDIKYIVVHCSATRAGQDISTKTIKDWHLKRGWSDIGYHMVIELDGSVHQGRPDWRIGAGVKGFNKHSIHICYVGGVDENLKPLDTRNETQKEALLDMLMHYKILHPKAIVLGHRDFKGVTKACPSFDAKKEYKFISDKYQNHFENLEDQDKNDK